MSKLAERPILFSSEMVRATLEGRKTQTRRAMKKQLIISHANPPRFSDTKTGDLFVCPDRFPTEMRDGKLLQRLVIAECTSIGNYHCMGIQQFSEKHCPYGVPGDRLWVRETFRSTDTLEFEAYRADIGTDRWNPAVDPDNCKWRPAIFMPRHRSRITLEITDVRVQRVQEISEEDAKAEGVTLRVAGVSESLNPIKTYRTGFVYLWNSINDKRGFGWLSNPWVWAISFQRIGDNQ